MGSASFDGVVSVASAATVVTHPVLLAVLDELRRR